MTATLTVKAILDHADLPGDIRVNPSPGPWIKVTGKDANGDPVQYHASTQDADAQAAIGRRIAATVLGDTAYDTDDDPVMDAYARYDSDHRVHGPDDFEAFRDAIAPLLDRR